MRYDAFISYKHSEPDMYVAKKIHAGLENYKLPPSVKKMSGRKKISRVFRDQEELPIGSDLGDNITKALNESEYLIVICSPRTKESYWVLKEIETFISLHDRQHVLAVLVEGEPADSFPELLLVDDGGNPVEPLAADVRGENKREISNRIKIELTRLAAALIGCNYDDLRQRRRERKIKHIAGLVSSAAIVIAGLAAGFALYNAKMAAEIETNYNLAVENYNLATENYRNAQVNESRYISEMAADLFEKGDRETAALLALEALGDKYDENSRPYSPQAEYALSRILYTYDIGKKMDMDVLLTHKLPVNDMRYSQGGNYILSSDQGGNVYVWDVNSNKNVLIISVSIDDEGNVFKPIAFDGNDDIFFVATMNGITAYDYSANVKWTYEADTLRRCISKAENGLIFLEFDGYVTVLNFDDGSEIGSTELDSGRTFSIALDYCEETNTFAVCAYAAPGNEDKTTYIYVYDLDTFEKRDIKVPFSDIAVLVCSKEGYIAAVGYEYDEVYADTDNGFDSYLVGYEPEKLNMLYKKEIQTSLSDYANSYYILKVRDFENSNTESGQSHELVMANGRNVYVIDTYTGEEISEFSFSQLIKSVRIATNTEWIYVAQEDGIIETANARSGSVDSTATIKTDVNLSDMSVYGKNMIIRKYGGTDLLLLKYHVGRNMNTIYTVNAGYIYGMKTSPDGETISLWENEDDFYIRLIDKKGNTLGIFDDKSVAGGFYGNQQFIADGRYLLTDGNYDIHIYDPKTMDDEIIKPFETAKFFLNKVYVSRNGKYAVMYSSVGAALIDLTCNEVKGCYKFDENGCTSVVSEDGKYIYTASNLSDFTIIDTASGQISKSDIRELKISNNMILHQNLAISADGKYVSVCCADNKVRIYNTVNKSIAYEYDMCGEVRQYMYFTNDSDKFVYQGDDYYIHIVDLTDGEMVYSAEGQWNMVEETFEVEDRGILVFSNSNGVEVLDSTTYVPVAYADEGGSYDAVNNVLYQFNRSGVYSFTYQTLDSLKDEAAKQFPDMELTAALRLKYNL